MSSTATLTGTWQGNRNVPNTETWNMFQERSEHGPRDWYRYRYYYYYYYYRQAAQRATLSLLNMRRPPQARNIS